MTPSPEPTPEDSPSGQEKAAAPSSPAPEVGAPSSITREGVAAHSKDSFVEREETSAITRMRGTEIGAVLAAGREGDASVEYSLQSVRMQRTDNRWPVHPGSVGAPWVCVGVRVCVRRRGRRLWAPFHRAAHSSIHAALEAMARDFAIPDEIIINPMLADLRRAYREEMTEPPAEVEPDAAATGTDGDGETAP